MLRPIWIIYINLRTVSYSTQFGKENFENYHRILLLHTIIQSLIKLHFYRRLKLFTTPCLTFLNKLQQHAVCKLDNKLLCIFCNYKDLTFSPLILRRNTSFSALDKFVPLQIEMAAFFSYRQMEFCSRYNLCQFLFCFF